MTIIRNDANRTLLMAIPSGEWVLARNCGVPRSALNHWVNAGWIQSRQYGAATKFAPKVEVRRIVEHVQTQAEANAEKRAVKRCLIRTNASRDRLLSIPKEWTLTVDVDVQHRLLDQWQERRLVEKRAVARDCGTYRAGVRPTEVRRIVDFVETDEDGLLRRTGRPMRKPKIADPRVRHERLNEERPMSMSEHLQRWTAACFRLSSLGAMVRE